MYSPTKSLLGPTAIEFQFHETCEGQFVKPSQCLVVNTIYLQLEIQVHLINVSKTSHVTKLVKICIHRMQTLSKFVECECKSVGLGQFNDCNNMLYPEVNKISVHISTV